MNKFVIIVAGGNGSRMNSEVPKQFLILKGKPVLYYAINTFLETYNDCKIILVLPVEFIAAGQEIIDAFFDYKSIQIVAGGRTRFHSVQNGLQIIEDEDCVIFVHDAARPMVSKALIERCYESVATYGSAIPVTDCRDSVRVITEDGNEPLNRETIKFVQTPQAFHSKIILPSFNKVDFKDRFTDEANVVESFGLKVTLVQGDDENIKITTMKDIQYLESSMMNHLS